MTNVLCADQLLNVRKRLESPLSSNRNLIPLRVRGLLAPTDNWLVPGLLFRQ